MENDEKNKKLMQWLRDNIETVMPNGKRLGDCNYDEVVKILESIDEFRAAICLN